MVEHNDLYGKIDFTKQQIDNNSDGPQLSYEETLLHEIRMNRIQTWLLLVCGCCIGIVGILLLLRM